MTPFYGPERGHSVTSGDEHQVAFRQSIAQRRVKPFVYVGPPVVVRIEYARTLFDCPNCHAGVLASREWQQALCRGCGAQYFAAALQWPDAAVMADLEVILGVRPEKHRHWFPSESLSQLFKENRDHAVAVPDALESTSVDDIKKDITTADKRLKEGVR